MRRFDLDGDARITFAEFAEAMTPVQPDVIQNPFRFTTTHKIYGDPLMTPGMARSIQHEDTKLQMRSFDVTSGEKTVPSALKQSRIVEDSQNTTLQISANDWNRDAFGSDFKSPMRGMGTSSSRKLLPKY